MIDFHLRPYACANWLIRQGALRFVFLCVLATSHVAIACQNAQPCTEQNQWSVGIAMGLGAITNPLVDADTIPQLILLDVAWYGERAYFDNGELGIRWIDSKYIGLETYLTFDKERAFFNFWQPSNVFVISSNIPDGALVSSAVSINGISSRRWAALLGNRVHYYSGNNSFTFALETDISSVHNGQRLELAYRKIWSGDKWQFQISPNIVYKSDSLTDYYYGLDAQDKLSEDLFYVGKGGVQAGLSLQYRYSLSERWQFLVNTGYSHFHKGMTNSPLLEKNYSLSLFMGAGYRF